MPRKAQVPARRASLRYRPPRKHRRRRLHQKCHPRRKLPGPWRNRPPRRKAAEQPLRSRSRSRSRAWVSAPPRPRSLCHPSAATLFLAPAAAQSRVRPPGPPCPSRSPWRRRHRHRHHQQQHQPPRKAASPRVSTSRGGFPRPRTLQGCLAPDRPPWVAPDPPSVLPNTPRRRCSTCTELLLRQNLQSPGCARLTTIGERAQGFV